MNTTLMAEEDEEQKKCNYFFIIGELHPSKNICGLLSIAFMYITDMTLVNMVIIQN